VGQKRGRPLERDATEPKLIILDEPFSGFDPINANLLKDEILELKQRGTTIIFSTHRMESVEELCDNIALINKSKVVLHGGKKEVKNRFKDNSYTIEFTGNLSNTNGLFEVLDSHALEDNIIKAHIKNTQEVPVNQLISSLIQQVELKSFNENIPSFNDIFIKVVGGEANELL
jgi:ABC-2 type transport system ATP-binding protein